MRLIISALFISITTIGLAQNISHLSLKNLDNQQVDFESIRGEKLTVIDFWTTWCKPCRKAIPELNKLFETYKDQGVNIVGLSCDGPRSVSKVRPVSNSLQISYPVLLDTGSELMTELNLSAFPSLIITNNKGEVLYTHEGFTPGDEIEIKENIEALLN
ncbi:MAG: TlpA family protein disulfide reductase [Cyclobacteriaceae bacterium]